MRPSRAGARGLARGLVGDRRHPLRVRRLVSGNLGLISGTLGQPSRETPLSRDKRNTRAVGRARPGELLGWARDLAEIWPRLQARRPCACRRLEAQCRRHGGDLGGERGEMGGRDALRRSAASSRSGRPARQEAPPVKTTFLRSSLCCSGSSACARGHGPGADDKATRRRGVARRARDAAESRRDEAEPLPRCGRAALRRSPDAPGIRREVAEIRRDVAARARAATAFSTSESSGVATPCLSSK